MRQQRSHVAQVRPNTVKNKRKKKWKWDSTLPVCYPNPSMDNKLYFDQPLITCLTSSSIILPFSLSWLRILVYLLFLTMNTFSLVTNLPTVLLAFRSLLKHHFGRDTTWISLYKAPYSLILIPYLFVLLSVCPHFNIDSRRTNIFLFTAVFPILGRLWLH